MRPPAASPDATPIECRRRSGSPASYYSLVRSEIEPLLPATASRILDVGCGMGRTAAWVKARFPGCCTIGLEGNAELLPELRRNVDEAYILDLNGPLPEFGRPDLVLALDVLEHLIDPASVLRQIVMRMAEAGTVIISLPNIAHLSVAIPLLLHGRFDYTDAGILDRTHLRFFYRETAVRLVEEAGLKIERLMFGGLDGPKSKLLDFVTGGVIRDRLAKQYLFGARRVR